ncbi:MAG TPA: hypothetical protein VG147_07410 [Solirubrobacteraceae bacterium]|nr:hypothetical protein [Solirubrobacteraceae bacterium]
MDRHQACLTIAPASTQSGDPAGGLLDIRVALHALRSAGVIALPIIRGSLTITPASMQAWAHGARVLCIRLVLLTAS